MNSSALVIASASNERYAIGLGVMMCSVLLTAERSFVRFHILDDEITTETKAQLVDLASSVARQRGVQVEINFLCFKQLDLPNLPTFRGSLTTYGRIYLPELLDEPSIFYVDADIVCNRPFPTEESLRLEHPNALLIGSADPTLHTLDHDCVCPEDLNEDERALPYINCGFVWMDLSSLLRFGISKKFQLLSTKVTEFRCADQSVLNFLCRGKIGVIPGDFNQFWNKMLALKSYTGFNIHFAGKVKPWLAEPSEKSLLQIELFNLVAQLFGFPISTISKKEEERITKTFLIRTRIRLIFYRVTFNKRLTKTQARLECWFSMKKFNQAYVAKLRDQLSEDQTY